MLMFCNVGSLVFRSTSFEANDWACACRSSLWCGYSNSWNGAWIYARGKWYNLLTCIILRCKRFMMSSKLAMYATSECLPAGHGNVCVFFGRDLRIKIYWMFSYYYTVHAMQSKLTPSLITFLDNDSLFLDYAINNKLTPFISMQNHYNLVYREEEREMFPTLKVRLPFSIEANDFKKFQHIFFKYSTWALVRFPGLLLLVVFLRVLMEMIPWRSAPRLMGMDIDLGGCISLNFFFFFFVFSSDISKATEIMQERKKLSTGKLIIFFYICLKCEKVWSW